MESRESSDGEDEQIVQVREALMCLAGKRFEGLRTARFLKHTTMSIDDDVFDLPLDAFICRPESVDPAKISFPGWASPSPNWVEWVDAMAERHAAVWRKAGVYDAILASRYEIKKQEELMMALVEKWCVETNTFVFPWGEATLTLEDMVVLGGFSVVGNNAMAPVKREEMKEVEEKMKKAKREIEGELVVGKKCSVGLWMKEMMKSGSEIEHEGFLVTWLSRFVFPSSADLVNDMLFPAAVQLAKGVTLALAPAVLAGIYRDLGLLKEVLAGYGEKETVVVKSPLQFVQVWAYERIMELQPPGQPGQLNPGEPRMARWHQHGGGQDLYGYPENVRAVLDSTKESFDFRPYTKPLSNFKFPKFYMEDNCWVHLHSDDKNIVAFGRCLRFCKLVGVNCIEPYYPHRVALQFGYDQDVPGVVSARNETPELAWKDYIRPIAGDMMYVPSRVSDGEVTVRYIRWWKLSFAMLQSEAKKISHKLLASPPRQKPTTTTTAATKVRETKTKKGSLGRSSSSGSLIGSEKGDKHPLKRPEWVQRSPPGWKKSPDRSSSSALGGGGAKDLKGVLRGLGRTKGQGHVTFQLPSPSPKSSPPSKTNTPLEKQNDSHVKKPRMIPRVADLAKRPSSSSQVPHPHRRDNYNDSSSRQASKEPYKAPSLSGYPPSKRKKSPRSLDIVNSPGQKSSLSPQQGSKESPKSPSVSGSSSLTRRNLPRSQELNKSSSSSLGSLSLARKKPPRSSESGNSSFGGGSSALKRNTDVSTKQESPRKAQELKATNVKFLEEIVTLREHVGEEGEVTYHIPKQQFEDLSQGVQDVLHDLHSIKSALNIQDDDE
ncbi:hypothetical protein Rs2_02589 [Raphanus sativus]|uniref:Uncharacterized protein LOC108807247 n=1 Tax=Raphanus sativus TaxID=3726 RepID=A0A6J0JHB3_RAPSA|nr:uncharacterized protein LOC108807247 [Raphanus sativus]KAJ4917039.1 hypothetical protein Rs2_02589 [Raphanus sativus]